MNYLVNFNFLLSVLCVSLPTQEFQIVDYDDYEKQVNLLENAEQYKIAIQLTKDVWDHFPNREFDLMKEMIYLNSKTGQYEDNLNLWKMGHQKEYFFLLNKRMDKYKPYLNFPEFEQLIEKDAQLRFASMDENKSIYQLELPNNFDSIKFYPLLIILHGGGSSIQKARERWTIIPALRKDIIVVFIQSYRPIDWNTFGWSSGDERSHEEIQQIFKEITFQYLIDSTRVYIGGMSAGGTMALDLALKAIIPVKNVIAFCPGLPRNLKPEDLPSNSLKVFMVAGETDFYLPKQEELVSFFKEKSVSYVYKIIPKMGHEFPENYESLILEALEFMGK